MSKIDALIVNPNGLNGIYQGLGNELAAIEPPIWAALLANHLRSKGKSVAIIDAEGSRLTYEESVKLAADYTPRLTVVVVYGQQPSASTQNMHGAGIFTKLYKETYPDRKVIFVGGHVSALPEKTLNEEKCDFVVKGEGPYTIHALLELNDLDNSSHYSKVPGLWWREDGKPQSGVPGKNIPQELLSTELPGLAWDLLPMQNYRAHNWHSFDRINERKPYASIYTSLGCPFKCTFCCINAPYGGSAFRYWEPEFIVKEFDILAEKYGVRNIKIADEMFVMNPNHFLKLANLLSERNHGFNIWAYARVDTVKPQYLDALKKAGVNWLALGIESGSKHVRDGVTKGRFTQDDIRTIVAKIKDAGINVIGNYIFGLPDDNFETMQETLDMAMDLNCEMANLYSAMAYPGSQLYNMAVEKNWELPKTWLGYSQHSFEALPLRTEHITAGEVLAFRDRAFDTYFKNPRYLNSIRQKFGDDTHKHIVEMTKHKLKRQNAAILPDRLSVIPHQISL